MIPLLTISDFQTHPFFIKDDTEFGNQEIENIILFEQEKQLKNILGDIEYYNFANDYDTNTEAWQSQIWIDFVNGADYIADDITINWAGIKHVLKGFVYAEWLRHQGRKVTNLGVQQQISENAANVNISFEYYGAINTAAEKSGADWVCESFMVKRRYDNYYKYNSDLKAKYKNTAFNFLYWYSQKDATVLTNWYFKQARKSVFGI